MDYSKTLHLPETEFPMRGNLPKKEPGFVEFWQQNHLYEKRIEKRKKEGAPTFVLHVILALCKRQDPHRSCAE